LVAAAEDHLLLYFLEFLVVQVAVPLGKWVRAVQGHQDKEIQVERLLHQVILAKVAAAVGVQVVLEVVQIIRLMVEMEVWAALLHYQVHH
jgi:hypothetical protein